MNVRLLCVSLALMGLLLVSCAPTVDVEEVSIDSFVGRWNVEVEGPDGTFPSWFELTRDNDTIQGRFVGRVGSARPISEIQVDGNRLVFSLPVQYESHPEDMRFEGFLGNGVIEGTTNAEDGQVLEFAARPAPELVRPAEPQWAESIELFNGMDLTGWKVRSEELPNNWQAVDGVLENTEAGTDLMTEEVFDDFRLELEFKYPEGSNSGIYLRGRYEVQIQDDIGKEPDSLYIGGVYGFLTPSVNAARPAGEWQSYDITLLGREVTVVLNGVTVIDQQEIPGITGGAIDGREDEPGPILLQGDHGPVSFRNIQLTPAR